MGGGIPLESPLGRIEVLLDRAFDYFFSLFVFATIFLLSGTIYGISFYSPLCAGILPFAAFSLFRRQRAKLGLLLLLMAIPMILSAWALLGLVNGFGLDGVKQQFFNIMFTFFLCWLVFVFCGDEECRRLRFLRLVLHSVIAASILKVGLIAYAISHGIPIFQMVVFLETIFGGDLMKMDVSALFGRVQFVSDGLIPVCVFIILRHRDRMGIGNLRAALTILLLLTSVVFSFSRYFWGFAALALVVGLVLGKRDRFQAILTLVLGISVIALLPVLTVLYQLRFSNKVAGESDVQRAEQIPALESFLMDDPLLGHGLGSYTTQVVRGTSEAGLYNYEVQLLAMPAQLGMLGMALLICLAIYYYSRLWWKGALKMPDRLGIGLLLLGWIAAGFSNPLLFNPVAGVIYATFATLAGMDEVKSKHAYLIQPTESVL